MSITQADQEGTKLSTDAYVALYYLDLTRIGGNEVFRFTQSSRESGPLMYGGQPYYPIDLEVDGFEWNGRGTLPTPKIRIANANRIMGGLVNNYNDLLGAPFVRIRTFRRFLDDGTSPDPTAHFPLDIYKIDRKVAHTKTSIEWELAASMDQEGKLIPGRQILRDVCTHRYLVFNADRGDFLHYNISTGQFDFGIATCPYRHQDGFFNERGEPLNEANKRFDRCGKKLSDCRLRFGTTDPLPTRAFPSAARLRP